MSKSRASLARATGISSQAFFSGHSLALLKCTHASRPHGSRPLFLTRTQTQSRFDSKRVEGWNKENKVRHVTKHQKPHLTQRLPSSDEPPSQNQDSKRHGRAQGVPIGASLPQSNILKTTLTNREREIFERAYLNVFRRGNGFGDQVLRELKDESVSQDNSLESIFNQVVCDKQRKNREAQPQLSLSVGSQMPDGNIQHTLTTGSTAMLNGPRTDTTSADGSSSQWRTMADVMKENKSRIDEFCRQDLKAFHMKLSSAETDTAVWAIFRQDVLSKVQDFEESVSQAKQGQLGLSGDDEASKKSENASLAVQTTSQWQKQPELLERLSILRNNYALQCVACINALRRRWPRSPYVLSILPRIKSLGTISYALGASTELYNELMYVRWVHYRDLHGCAELLEEMLARSVPTDAKTRAVYNDASRRRTQGQEFWTSGKTDPEPLQLTTSTPVEVDATMARFRSESKTSKGGTAWTLGEYMMTPGAAAWWHLQGTESGYEKWRALEQRAVKEYGDEQERKAEELARVLTEEEEDDDDDSNDDIDEDPDPEIELARQGEDNRAGKALHQAALVG